MGLSSGPHVMSLYRASLTHRGILDSWAFGSLENGQWARVAGLVVVHQAPPTAKGFHFVTLEDEAGLIDVVFRPQVYQTYRELLRTVSVLLVEGIVRREGEVVNLLARRAAALPDFGEV